MLGPWVACRRIGPVWLFERHLSRRRYPEIVSLWLGLVDGTPQVPERELRLTSVGVTMYPRRRRGETYCRVGHLETVSTTVSNVVFVPSNSPSGVPEWTDFDEQ